MIYSMFMTSKINGILVLTTELLKARHIGMIERIVAFVAHMEIISNQFPRVFYGYTLEVAVHSDNKAADGVLNHSDYILIGLLPSIS
uniref:Uncharacterized protein n=1 Tax=Lactuca sativa TaxID=4236 RepID=A0A9R1VV79_LACSA|nr:hypothetical protein LSAT_V11C400211610 [Lactuca sativa]